MYGFIAAGQLIVIHSQMGGAGDAVAPQGPDIGFWLLLLGEEA